MIFEDGKHRKTGSPQGMHPRGSPRAWNPHRAPCSHVRAEETPSLEKAMGRGPSCVRVRYTGPPCVHQDEGGTRVMGAKSR